ncbi:MAG: hypothetical protein OXU32_16335 [Gammaproteobacteria bacterium]|nr:hypothetical protein [Gammaproteobacteria bacterium]
MTVDEGGRHLALASPHENRFGLDGGHGAHGVVLEPEQRDRFPVDGDVDVLGGDLVAAAELRLHPEDVLAVRREVVRHHHPAPGAEGRSLDLLPRVLRHLEGVAVLGGGGQGLRVSDGEPADVDGGLQVGVQQGGREALGGGHVVEAPHQQILGKPVVRVHLESQEFVDDALVFGPAEPLKPPRAQIGERAGDLVDGGFQRLHQRQQGIGRRARNPGRRHHPRAKLADHLFRGLPLLCGGLHGEVLQREVAGEERVVVADHAVLLDDGRERGGRRGGGGSGNGLGRVGGAKTDVE